MRVRSKSKEHLVRVSCSFSVLSIWKAGWPEEILSSLGNLTEGWVEACVRKAS